MAHLAALWFLLLSLATYWPMSCGPVPGAGGLDGGTAADSGEQVAAPKTAPASALAEAERARLLEEAVRSIPSGDKDAARTLSPYFFVLSDDPEVDRLPLASTRAEVRIAGVIADVRVTQVYKNSGRRALEAVYVFPASTRAAVYQMRMRIGTRVVEARIAQRKKAREAYEQARREGRTASLLEEQRPNVFQMNVANIQPGDEVRVELCYTELLVPEDGVYEFVYPTVVGPRYSNRPEEGAPEAERFSQNPTLTEGADAPYGFTLSAHVRSGVPVERVESPSHEIEVEREGERVAHVALKDGQNGGDRDFVLRYSLAGQKIQSGLLLYPGAEESFFLLMVEPPKRIVPEQLVAREYIFILDVSGSMYGFPLDITKKLMRRLLSELRPQDRFNILTFSGGSKVLAPESLAATPENLARTASFIDKLEGGGGTEIVPALRAALALPRAAGTSRVVIVATDGYVTVEKECFALVREHLGEANLFAFGIGRSVNRYLIEGLARAGMGEPFVVLSQSEADPAGQKLMDMVSRPLMQGVRVRFEGFSAYDVEPPAIPDLFANKPLIVFGKYRGQAPSYGRLSGVPGTRLGTGLEEDKNIMNQGVIYIEGHVPGSTLAEKVELASADKSAENSALRALWARHRVATLSDQNALDEADARVKEITGLGLKYSILTSYTSFVAIDSEVRGDGRPVTVRQPLPMPSGVSNLAVGGSLGKSGLGTCGSCGGRGLLSIAPNSVVHGTLDPGRIRKAVQQKQVRIQQCYRKALERNPTLAGKIVVRLTVGADGKVKAAVITENTLSDAGVEKCLIELVRGLVFPANPGGGEVVVSYPFIFQPAG